MLRTAVIIPHFQRQPGLLAVAVRSALAQEDAGPVTVVVCDDGSPVPASTDLATLSAVERGCVLLIEQANAGAGAARNAALDAVPPGTEWIAFLDSDDRWSNQHLARSIAALREGHDLCFSDALREPEVRTHFQGAGFRPSEHAPIGALPGLYRFTGNFMTLNVTVSPVSISTVVMRASALGDLRFPCMAFEDLMYWFEAARRPIRVAFDATLQVHYGRGAITLTEGWKSQGALRNCLLYHRIFARVRREFALTDAQRVILDARMARNRHGFAMTALGLLRNGTVPAFRVVAGFLALDPWGCGAALRAAVTGPAWRLPARRSGTDEATRLHS